MADTEASHEPTGWRVGTGHLTMGGTFFHYKGSERLDTADAVREHIRQAMAEQLDRAPDAQAEERARAISGQFDADAPDHAWTPSEDFRTYALADGVRYWVEPVYAVLTIAEKYAAVAHEPSAWLAREPWEKRIPSVIYRGGKRGDLLDLFHAVADEAGKALSHMDGERDGYLYSALCQDAGAVAAGMPEDRRVTCAEHRTWRTAAHLADAHADQSV